MKWPVVIAGLLVGGAVGASLILGGGSEASDDRSTSAAPERMQEARAPVAAAPASIGKRGSASPSRIFAGGFKTPAEVKAAFKQQGENWTTSNLLTFPKAARDSCPQGDDGNERALYVRYVTDYPSNDQGQPTLLYTDIKVPGPGGGQFNYQTPDITEKVIRGDYQWKRRYYTRWWSGTNQEWVRELRARQERLDEEFMEAQNTSPQRAIQITQEMARLQNEIRTGGVQSLNEEVYDIVEVEAPSSDWSFKYDNQTKQGDPLYRREAPVNFVEGLGGSTENIEQLLEVFDPIRQFGENIENGGTRTILGYECTVQRAGGWDAEACMADINGERVSLWTRFDKAQSTAVYIDPAPCVPMAQFMPPNDVDFDQEW